MNDAIDSADRSASAVNATHFPGDAAFSRTGITLEAVTHEKRPVAGANEPLCCG